MSRRSLVSAAGGLWYYLVPGTEPDFLRHWLLKYDYRITIGPAVFILAALAALLITLVTISFQAFRAAVSNPVKSLRTE